MEHSPPTDGWDCFHTNTGYRDNLKSLKLLMCVGSVDVSPLDERHHGSSCRTVQSKYWTAWLSEDNSTGMTADVCLFARGSILERFLKALCDFPGDGADNRCAVRLCSSRLLFGRSPRSASYSLAADMYPDGPEGNLSALQGGFLQVTGGCFKIK